MTRSLPLLLVVIAALAYPLAVVGGGAPRFPSRSECSDTASRDADIEAVFGRVDRQSDAAALQRRVLHLGFKGAEIERDGCGHLKVLVHGITTLAVGRELAAEAQRVGLHVSLEYAG